MVLSVQCTEMEKRMGPRLHYQTSWLPLAMGGSSHNLGLAFWTIHVHPPLDSQSIRSVSRPTPWKSLLLPYHMLLEMASDEGESNKVRQLIIICTHRYDKLFCSNQKSSSWRKVSKLSSVTTLLHGVHSSSEDENERKRRKERVAEQLEKNYYFDDGVAKWPIVYPIATSGRRQVGREDILQGDHSACSQLSQPPVDIDLKVAF